MSGDFWDERLVRYGFAPAPPPKPVSAEPLVTGDNPAYAEAALRDEIARVTNAIEGTRNDSLNIAAFSLASLVAAGALDRDTVTDALTSAARSVGLPEIEIRNTIASGFAGSAAKVGAREIPAERLDIIEVTPGTLNGNGHAPTAFVGRQINMPPHVSDDTPDWAWSYGGKGRIQRGTLALFAGRPGAGKSTAARWFAAQATLGALEGCWYGTAQNVAYIAPAEESHRYVIVPGLRAAGADLSHMRYPSVLDTDGRATRLLSLLDEELLTQALLAHRCAVVIVDPLMSTIGANVDIHRNNEVRAYIEPWARIADAINGVVLAVVHLRKGPGGDLVAGITGSSAFGEIARAVFGFAKDPDSDEGERVLSQGKNSTGYEDLALTYRIEPASVLTDAGSVAEVGKFVITGTSDVTVDEVLIAGPSAVDATTSTECRLWLADYLEAAGCEASKSVKAAAKKEGFSEATVHRAKRKLRVVVTSRGFPRTTYWELPKAQSDHSGPKRKD